MTTEFHGMQKIKSVNIQKFRHLEDVNFDTGDKITVIAGRNGTGKSSILGLIAHVFDFKGSQKTISGKKFSAEFGKVFRFSVKHESNKSYSYDVNFEDGTKKAATFSGFNETEQRFRIHVGKKQEGSGKVDVPIIYLGLGRLFPIAEEKDKDIKIDDTIQIASDDLEWYKKYYNLIFASSDEISVEKYKTIHKQFISPAHDVHDSFGNSAGQDNLGQILSAVLSFKKLKDEMGDDYPGGLLLIDELDATIFPGAQLKIMEYFLKFSKDYGLQIIFTTHSTDILNELIKEKFKQSVKLLFLEKRGSRVITHTDSEDIEKILCALRYEIVPNDNDSNKIDLYTEDEEARYFLSNIMNSELKKKVFLRKVNLGGTEYVHLRKNKVPSFLKSVVVLDGDTHGRFDNFVSLPGENRPENVIYDFLDSLDDEDEFWGGLGGYNKEYFNSHKPVNCCDRTIMKNWFKDHKAHWGKNIRKVMKAWKDKNVPFVEEFNENLSKAISKVSR